MEGCGRVSQKWWSQQTKKWGRYNEVLQADET